MCAQRHPVDENRGPVREAPILVYSANAFAFRCLLAVRKVEKRVSIRFELLIGF